MKESGIEAIENYGLSKRNRSRTLFSRIGVVGCGKEGSVIVTSAALNGIEVVFFESHQSEIEDAYVRIEGKLNKKIKNWGLTEGEKKAVLSRISSTTSFEGFANCDFVIEATRYSSLTGERDTNLRKDVFHQLEKVLPSTAIIASNIATCIVTELSSELEFKDRCIGLHYLSNVPDSSIIEIVRGLYTSDETYEKVCKFVKLINNQFISVEESAGLVSVRLYLVQLNEACSIIMEGVSTIEDVDKILTVGFGYRQGVFRTADQMGIEKIVKLMENLYTEFGHVKYKPSPILLHHFRAKHFGISTLKGFYNYDENGNII